MYSLTKNKIRYEIADSSIIFKRGDNIYKIGNYYLKESDFLKRSFRYNIDGNYGDYEVNINFSNGGISYSCTCPYPGSGCKHIVAVCLDIIDRLNRHKSSETERICKIHPDDSDELTYEEIKAQAYENRKKSASSNMFQITLGDTYKGEHLIINERGKEYIVTFHEPEKGSGHCTCPDFYTNKLGTCKHLIHIHSHIKKKRDFFSQIKKEQFPFVHIYWDSVLEKPRYFYDNSFPVDLTNDFNKYFNNDKTFKKNDITKLYPLLEKVRTIKKVKVDEYIIKRIDDALFQKKIDRLFKKSISYDYSAVNIDLYPYQKKGVDFSLFKKSSIIADEMGLGKTLQAITVAMLKRNIFKFEKTLVICPASLKEQWKREIERFTNEKTCIISGDKSTRQETYRNNTDFFKITNYEAVLRDIMAIQRFKPDFVILDEAQRIKNFETKTAQAIKSIPYIHSLVITGTPLENKLEDLYSIVQFVNPELFSPLWEFASQYFILKKSKKNKIFGYRNLNTIHQNLKTFLIRRKKEEVIDDLPEQVTNNFYIDLTIEQREIHQGYLRALLPLLNKKFLTPVDVRRIQELLTSMRMVCNSTFLIDRKTNLSPKLQELQNILSDLIVENRRKAVIFTEWTTMTFLIGKVLSELEIPFVEFTGKIPVSKRQNLITEFIENPDCKVFLGTEAGGLGLNLQAADCVINFELPWNPAKLNQRIGRVLRLGQKSKCINVINLIAKNSIEEKILAGIHLKQELFDGVFDGTTDEVEFSIAKKNEFINKIREMLNEEPIVTVKEASDSPDIPESTPYFLNKKALDEEKLDITGEEDINEVDELSDDLKKESARSGADRQPTTEHAPSSEKIEEVLENGMKFLNGIMMLSLGKPLIEDKESKAITVDNETGEVTLKFKIPK